MKVTLVIVASINGKTTKGDDPYIYSWTSKEDSDFFFSLHKKHNLIIMGRKTYEAAKNIIKPDPGRLRVVLTHSPEKYKKEEVPGLEFSKESPEKLVKRLEKEGYTQALCVGGSAIASEFLKAGLLSDMYITLEPLLFGKGRDIVDDCDLSVPLKLDSIQQVNTNGTIILHYLIKT